MSAPYNFLLFDAARAVGKIVKAQQLNDINRSLYKGSAEEDLAGIAPYLFSVEAGSEFENWFFTNGYGNAWGVLISANVPFEDCYKHFRKFLMIKTEEGKQLYFRFYDPRVLRIFLPGCNTEQLKEFFGPVRMFIIEDEDPGFTVEYWLENFQLKSRRIPANEVFADLAAVPAVELDRP